jgi:hypothetical protein
MIQTSLKNNLNKKGEGMAQVVQHLSNKNEL